MAAARKGRRRAPPREPRALPAYTKVEASRYVRIPHRTLHSWVSGTHPLVSLADPSRHLLSFENLVEVHVLAALWHVHGVRMRLIRKALDCLRMRLHVVTPLADEQMLTDGKTILVRRLGQLIDAGHDGQASMLELLDLYLDRIERDPSGFPNRLFPFTRKRPRDRRTAERETRVIAIDPTVAFGRAVIVGTRISTAEVADRYKAGDSIDDLAADYGRTQADIEEAIRCELDLKAA